MTFSRKAAALRYLSEEESAPRIVAKGRGYIAEKIIEAARAHGIEIREDTSLAAALDALELNTEIPEELYRAVAEVLAMVYRADKKM